MARTQDGSLMSVAEAKARLRELGLRKSEAPTGFLESPLFRSGALLLGGALLGRLFKRGGKPAASGIGDTIVKSMAAAAPLLIATLLKSLSQGEKRAASPGAPGAPAHRTSV